MPARNTELRVGRLVNDLAKVSLWETEGSGKPDLPPLSHCKRSWQTIVVHNTKKQEFLGSSVWASGSRDFESPDMSYLLISVRSCRERWLRSIPFIPTPGRDRAFDFSPCFFQWAPPGAPAAEGTGHREDTPPELRLFFFFFSLLKVLCHCQEEHPCRTWPQRGNSQGGEAPVITEDWDAQWGTQRSCWQGDRSSRRAGWESRRSPSKPPPDGPTTTGPSLLSQLDPLTQASQTHRNFACANRREALHLGWRSTSKGGTQAGRTDLLMPQKKWAWRQGAARTVSTHKAGLPSVTQATWGQTTGNTRRKPVHETRGPLWVSSHQ